MDFDSWCLVVLAGTGPEGWPMTGEKVDQARRHSLRPAGGWGHGIAVTAGQWSNGNMGGVRRSG